MKALSNQLKLVVLNAILATVFQSSFFPLFHPHFVGLASYQTSSDEGKTAERKGRTCSVVIQCKAFNSNKHRLRFHKKHKNVLIAIDGKRPSGTDGQIPEIEINSIQIQINGVLYRFPDSQFDTLFNVTRLELERVFALSEYPQKYEITLSGSDGAGGYHVKWIISKNSKKITRVLSEFPDPDKPIKSHSKLIKIN